MTTEQTTVKRLASRQQLLVRGESLIASIGIATAVILLAVMSAVGWWTLRHQKQSLFDARQQQVALLSQMLGQSAESMLAGNEVSSLRRMVVDAKRDSDLLECRIVLPGGGVIADGDPARITLTGLPERWTAAPVDDLVHEGDAQVITVNHPLLVPGRGGAVLQIVASVRYPASRYWEIQTNLGLIGAGGMGALLLLYRHTRRRLRTLSLIREALLNMESGDPQVDIMAIRADAGPEARAWNDLLAQTQKLREQALAEHARQAMGDRRQGRGDLDHACDALSQGMLIVDEHLKIKYGNGAAAVFLQAKREQLTGGDAKELIKDEQVREAIMGVVEGKGAGRRAVEVQRAEGGGVLRFNARRLRRDDPAGVLVTIEDVTQQRVAEASRSSFIAQATHELRTPLTNIRLYMETALDAGEKDPALREKCLNVVNQECRRLERMVGEMLSVAEVEAGSLKIDQGDVRLDRVFEEMAADFEAQAKEKKIGLEFKLPPKLPVIQGDRNKLTLALHNLVGNALKYTPGGGNVIVSVNVGDSRLAVEVIDTGIGIDDQEAELIFEKFYRSKDPRVAKVTGTGLGLALAREVARLHGGDVTVQSHLDKGSTFTLTVPLPMRAA